MRWDGFKVDRALDYVKDGILQMSYQLFMEATFRGERTHDQATESPEVLHTEIELESFHKVLCAFAVQRGFKSCRIQEEGDFVEVFGAPCD